MRNMVQCYKAMSVCVCMLVLVGCAGPQFQPATPEANQALVYLYQPSELLSDGEHNLVAINEKVVAEIEAGSYFVLAVSPGRISVTRTLTSVFGMLSPSAHIGLWEGFVEVENFGATSGHRYYVRFPEGVLMEDEQVQEALEQMHELTLLEPYQE